MWEQARSSAGRATALAASVENDFAFVPAAYHLVWFLAVGIKGETFDKSEVDKLLQDIDRSEKRLAAWGIKDRVLFDCAPTRYLIGLKGEWARYEGKKSGTTAGDNGKGKKGKQSKKEQKATLAAIEEERERQELLEECPEGHLPVTDWRVFDQRFYGFYTWLEAPMQQETIKCPQCGRPCERVVHRCVAAGTALSIAADYLLFACCSCVLVPLQAAVVYPYLPCVTATSKQRTVEMSCLMVQSKCNTLVQALPCRCLTCKNAAYCSVVCTQAHMFDHECDPAPKPWLSPPTGPSVKPPDELGEEGFLGFIPWSMVRYAMLVGLTWGCIWSYRWFDDFRYAFRSTRWQTLCCSPVIVLSKAEAAISSACS